MFELELRGVYESSNILHQYFCDIRIVSSSTYWTHLPGHEHDFWEYTIHPGLRNVFWDKLHLHVCVLNIAIICSTRGFWPRWAGLRPPALFFDRYTAPPGRVLNLNYPNSVLMCCCVSDKIWSSRVRFTVRLVYRRILVSYSASYHRPALSTAFEKVVCLFR